MMHGLMMCWMMAASPSPMWADFAMQPAESRPRLEVRYTDSSRRAFEVLGETYHVVGGLHAPHALTDAETGDTWLALSAEDEGGAVWTAARFERPSRINLYRRGPWYCEVHWFDIQLANAQGQAAPMKADLALYCFPEKILASVRWHGLGDFGPATLKAAGLSPKAWPMKPYEKGLVQSFSFPIFGETEPLGEEALATHDADAPLAYDATRGLYRIGSHNPGGFEQHFFDHPNYREQVRFTITNDAEPRTIHVCHETSSGFPGLVEGGVLLDAEGHPLPMVVQVSKNFAGEKEEAFYNPEDTPFSETFFPLVLEPNEEVTLTSVHLYQNWGNHMTKHFSSLGAWMDYFHSSTGVTETTCYVPFKFGGLPGVTIADFRAMSQPTFWRGQPQHDNVAGHSFLSYEAGGWQYMTYRGTTYTSTGMNWMDIGLSYLSSDGAVRGTVRTFELPQADELRNFIRMRYEVLKPVTIENARENLRFLTVAQWVQKLRFTHAAATGMEDKELRFEKDHFAISGHPLPRENAFLALYGDPRGSNAIVIRKWTAPFEPAMSVWCKDNGDTRLLLTAAQDRVELQPGDVIEIDGMWMPYGVVDSADTPRRETVCHGSDAPRVTGVAVGTLESSFPAVVRAENNTAELTVRGGRGVIPIIVTGLSDYRWPRLYRKDSGGWTLVDHARVGALDGVQVFAESGGAFGAVMLTHGGSAPQTLRVTAGRETEAPERIAARIKKPSAQAPREHIVELQAPWMQAPLKLRFPETVSLNGAFAFIDHTLEGQDAQYDSEELAGQWNEDSDGTVSFAWRMRPYNVGGRLSPNVDDVDIEFWVENLGKDPVSINTQFCPVLEGAMFEYGLDSLDRVFLHIGGAWKPLSETDRGGGNPGLVHYASAKTPGLPETLPEPWGVSTAKVDVDVAAVVSKDGKHIFAIACPDPISFLTNCYLPCVHADPTWPVCPPGRRAVVRGKIYLMQGTLEDLLHRVRRENIR